MSNRRRHLDIKDDEAPIHNPRKSKVDKSLKLTHIKPKTENQGKVFQSWWEGKNLLLTGCAGSGKTFLAMYLALREVELKNVGKVHIFRSTVSTRDQGFLPGNPREKAKVFEPPYEGATSQLYGRGDAYGVLKGKNQIEFSSTSFMRGTTLDNTVMILDEIQNMTWGEIDTLMTRVGDNTRIIVCGDTRQGDPLKVYEKRGVADIIRVANSMEIFEVIEFGYDDIVRSGFVRDFIMTRDRLGI